jgi:hypothetical protein
MPAHNKRYSKCGVACSLKHLKSLHTFVLADFEQQFSPALAGASVVSCYLERQDRAKNITCFLLKKHLSLHKLLLE